MAKLKKDAKYCVLNVIQMKEKKNVNQNIQQSGKQNVYFKWINNF